MTFKNIIEAILSGIGKHTYKDRYRTSVTFSQSLYEKFRQDCEIRGIPPGTIFERFMELWIESGSHNDRK